MKGMSLELISSNRDLLAKRNDLKKKNLITLKLKGNFKDSSIIKKKWRKSFLSRDNLQASP